MRKRSFTLIEVTLALPLMALIFSFLFMTYSRTVKNNKDLDLRENRALKDHYFQRRLQKKLWLATDEKKAPKEFFKKEAFLFYYYHGISLDPHARGKLLAKLFLENRTLKLALYQNKGKTLVRTEALLEDIDQLNIEYLYEASSTNNKIMDSLSVNPQETKEMNFVAINLHLTKGQDTKKYFFHLQRKPS